MLSVGSSDGRSALGFRIRGEMEDTELEEGEAYYQDDDGAVDYDPDAALSSLSYIDEKLRDVLGHFQKDFEGGVSAENLGAKFGGYGSFLPTYPRSPSIWSHEFRPTTPQKVHMHDTTKSPNNLPLEGARQNPTITANVSHSIRPVPAYNSVQPSSTTSRVDKSIKRKMLLSTARDPGEFIPKQEPINRFVDDRKMLMIGADNGSARNKAAIYSGLGLDISPSSSPEDNPDGSGGLSDEFPDIDAYESSMIILQIMTSFPVPGECLLSPISESLLHLTEKERPVLKDSKAETFCKASQEVATMSKDQPPSANEMKGFGENKKKSTEKNGRPMAVKVANVVDSEDCMNDHLKKETDIETPAGEELVPNPLKIPLLPRGLVEKAERQKNVDRAGLTSRDSDLLREPNKGMARERTFSSDSGMEETSESISIQDASRGSNVGNELVPLKGKLNRNTFPEDSVLGEKKNSSNKDISAHPRKDGGQNGDKKISKVDSDGQMVRKDQSCLSLEPSGQKAAQKAVPYEQDGVKMSRRKEGKKKIKGHQNNGTPSEELLKDKKGLQARDFFSGDNNDVERLHKELSKAALKEYHKDPLVDVEAEQVDNRTDSLEKYFKEKPKDQKLKIEKANHALVEKSTERPAGKLVENPSAFDEYVKAPTAMPSTENGPISDAVPALGVPPVLDNWVCCDKCQTWRLLPLGMNSEDLPEKWKCSMITWLPGMNKCSFSEEETTKALNALYQVSVPENQNNIHSQHNGAGSGTVLADAHLDQSPELGSHAVPHVGKKKAALKDTSNVLGRLNLMRLPNSSKKNQQAAVKSTSSNDVNQHTSKSHDFALEKPRHKQKEKQKLAECHSDGEQSVKHPKTKSKRDADPDNLRISKKIKAEGSHYTNEGCLSDHAVKGKSFPSSSNSMLIKVAAKNPQKHSDYSPAKELKGSAGNDLLSSAKKPKAQVQVSLDGEYKADFGASDMGASDNADFAAKKRKVKEWPDHQACTRSFVTGGHPPYNGVEEISDSDFRKDKKAKLSKSEGRESGKSKADGRTDKKGKVPKIVLSSRGRISNGMDEGSRGGIGKGHQPVQYNGNAVSHQSLDGIDSLKRDLGYSQASMAATSSSSKVSGSHKSKANGQEVKGSPVESVSSSPFRASNMDKLTTERPVQVGKEDALNAGLFIMGSPKRCSLGEGDGRNDRSGRPRKEIRQTVDSSVPYDYQDGDANQISGNRAKDSMLSTTFGDTVEVENANLVDGVAGTLDQHKLHCTEVLGIGASDCDPKLPNSHHRANGSSKCKSAKGSSSQSRDGQRSAGSDFDKGKIKGSNSFNVHEKPYSTKGTGGCKYGTNVDSHGCSPCHEDPKDGKFMFNESCSNKTARDDKNYFDKKESKEKWSSESRRENHLRSGMHGKADGRLDASCSKDGKSSLQKKLLQAGSQEDEKSSNGFLSGKTDQADMTSERGQAQFAPLGDKHETQSQCPQSIPNKESGSDVLPVHSSDGDALKVPKQPRKLDNPNGLQHSTPNGFASRDLITRSPVRKSSSQAAANTLKEAKDIKHSANRLRDNGLELESTDLYFQASLKFLHAASLLEACNVESAKHGETTQSMQVYTDTAKLCEFCAFKYERCKQMAAAALAYKCMEVAHMRVIYCKHDVARADWHELHAPLQVVPPGESPSSSASDLDNLNGQAVLERAALTKGVTAPQVVGNHIIAARNRPNLVRILKFTRDVDLAMEASRKWQNAFQAANAGAEEARYDPQGISSVKGVLDFSFHDIEGLLRLVRLAMEAIGR